MNSKKNPSFAHLCVISHLFGTVRYVFQMTEAERTKFCGGNKDQKLNERFLVLWIFGFIF